MMTTRGHTVIAGRPVNIGQHTDPLAKGTLTKRVTGYRRSDFTPNRTPFDIGEFFVCMVWIVGVLAALTLLAMVQP